MKILISALLFALLIPVSGYSQSNWEAGIRIWNNVAADVTIPIAKRPRLHAAAYFGNDFGLGGYFDWLFGLSDGPEGLKFYPGVGPEIYFGNDLDIGIAGNFGVEYSFDFPLTVAFDWRPGFMLTDSFRWYDGNLGITARFRFGEGTRIVAK